MRTAILSRCIPGLHARLVSWEQPLERMARVRRKLLHCSIFIPCPLVLFRYRTQFISLRIVFTRQSKSLTALWIDSYCETVKTSGRMSNRARHSSEYG